MDFADLRKAFQPLFDHLDHNYLNEIDGLENPTLENISTWIWNRLSQKFPDLSEVVIARDSCKEGCVYRGPKR